MPGTLENSPKRGGALVCPLIASKMSPRCEAFCWTELVFSLLTIIRGVERSFD